MPAPEVLLLGPMAALVDRRSIELGRGNEGVLVVLLALNVPHPVATEGIMDVLWPEGPPPTAREMVRIYVGRTRRRLGEKAIVTSPGGYALDTAPESVDAIRFARLCRSASDLLEKGDPRGAIEASEQALSLWRGPPLAELGSATALVRDERARLMELRLTALEDRLEAELALGRAARLVTDLESLVREQPYRERLRMQLMLALYRSGRQKHALDAYQETRRLFVEQLGVEPSPDLQELQRAILAHDQSLRLTRPVTISPHQPATSPVAPRPGRRVAGAPGIAVLVVAAAASALFLAQSGSGTHSIRRNSIGMLDATSGMIVGSVVVGGLPGPIAAGASHVWVGDGDRASLREFDKRNLRSSRVIHLPGFPYRILSGLGALWVSNSFDGRVVRIDERTGKHVVFRPEQHSSGRVQLAAAYGSLWTASQDGTLARLNPHTLRPIALIHRIGFPEAIASGSGAIWIAEATRDDILRVDPGTNRVIRSIPIGGRAAAVSVGDGSVWAVTPLENRLWRIDPRTDAVTASIGLAGRPISVALTHRAVWVGSSSAAISEVDPRMNRVVKTVAVAGPIGALIARGRYLWASVQ